MKYPIWLAISAIILSCNQIVLAEKPSEGNHHQSIYISQDTTDSTQIEAEIGEFINNWGEAWSPKENAPQFTRESLIP